MQSRETGGTLIDMMSEQQMKERYVTILEGPGGGLTIPLEAQAVVLFARGSGSSRYRSRNQFVATVLNNNGTATLLVDLLSQDEKTISRRLIIAAPVAANQIIQCLTSEVDQMEVIRKPSDFKAVVQFYRVRSCLG
jgi:hypothetical protein